MTPIRVLVVDDSPLVRALLTEIIDREPDMTVVGVAGDPFAAREKIRELAPTVVTLDVEMPRMNGVDFLERIMRLRPLPVVMLSSLTEAGAETTLRALAIGAVDVVAKPTVGVGDGIRRLADELTTKIRAAASARIRPRRVDARRDPAPIAATAAGSGALIGIGASTGGTEALLQVLRRVPAVAPPIAVVQHMPPGFTRNFAARLDAQCAIAVREAADGETLAAGCAYIAPGDAHLVVEPAGSGYRARLDRETERGLHRPSVDVLFSSIAAAAGRRSVGVLLTGMGRDGAEGLYEMMRRGAETIAQDEATSLVYGMPRAAVENGAARLVAPLHRIADRMLAAAARIG